MPHYSDKQPLTEDDFARANARIDIRAILAAKPRGLCFCPFHPNSQTPAFSVRHQDGRDLWKCFAGCGSGDGVDFLAKLEGVSTGSIVERFLGKSSPSVKPIKKRKPKAAPRPPRNQHERMREIWQGSKGFEKTSHIVARRAREVIERRLGPHTERAFELDLLRVAHPRYGLSRWCILFPLYECPPIEGEVSAMNAFPVDFERRSLDPSDRPKTKKMPRACPGAVRCFGGIFNALLDADDRDLFIVEGDFNTLTHQLSLAPERNVIGIPGTGFARGVAERLHHEIQFLRGKGASTPRRFVLDFDRDQAGDKAAELFAVLAQKLEIKVARIKRR